MSDDTKALTAPEIIEEDRKQVLELLDVESGLSDWEVNFAENCDKQLDRGRTLTDKQRAKLREILDGRD